MLKQETKTPLVSVIIANYNGGGFLKRCLTSILFETNRNFEIIVVDDGSTDDSLEVISAIASKDKRVIIVLNDKNKGAAESRNIGAAKSKGNYLFFLDTDTLVKEGWFNGIDIFFSTHPDVGLAQVKLLKMGTTTFDYAGDYLSPFGFLVERAREATDQGQFDSNEPIFALKSAGMIVRRKVFNVVAGFDRDYHIFWEDTDLAWRIWLAGWKVALAHKIVVWHAYGTKEKGATIYVHNQVVYRGCKNMITSLLKNMGNTRLIYALPINVWCWSMLAIAFLAKSQPRNGLLIFRGIWWNIINIASTLHKRKIIQQTRKINDTQLFAMIGTHKGVAYYFGKAKAYVLGKPF